jgi:hypothetical protein
MRLYTSYIGGGDIINNDEFISDATRIVLATRILGKWVDNQQAPLRLLLNHIIIIDNTFGEDGMYALYEYVDNFKDCVPALLTVLYFMGKVSKPAFVDYDLLNKLNTLDKQNDQRRQLSVHCA